MFRDKNIGNCRVLKDGRITIPKEVREKLSVKDGDFVDFLLKTLVSFYHIPNCSYKSNHLLLFLFLIYF